MCVPGCMCVCVCVVSCHMDACVGSCRYVFEMMSLNINRFDTCN